jgi:deazaflavin-dependent oxidoreductase (nitroreductase family)
MAELPSAKRVAVETQKAMTTAHRMLLESWVGPFVARLGWQEFLVLRTTGRKSGQHRETPLSFTRDGDAFVVIGSNGGAPRDPDWVHNLRASPDASVVIGGAAPRHVRAEFLTGADRKRLWDAAVRTYPLYAAYQARARREIPVVRLAPQREGAAGRG